MYRRIYTVYIVYNKMNINIIKLNYDQLSS